MERKFDAWDGFAGKKNREFVARGELVGSGVKVYRWGGLVGKGGGCRLKGRKFVARCGPAGKRSGSMLRMGRLVTKRSGSLLPPDSCW